MCIYNTVVEHASNNRVFWVGKRTHNVLELLPYKVLLTLKHDKVLKIISYLLSS